MLPPLPGAIRSVHFMRLLRFPDLSDRVGLRHSAIYDAIRKGTFPKPVSLGRKAVAWLES